MLAGVAGCDRAAPSLLCACGENGSPPLFDVRNAAFVMSATRDVGDTAAAFVAVAAGEERVMSLRSRSRSRPRSWSSSPRLLVGPERGAAANVCGHAADVREGDDDDDGSADAPGAGGELPVSDGMVSRGVLLRTARTLATCALEYTTVGRRASSSDGLLAFLNVRGEMKTDGDVLALLVSSRGVMGSGDASRGDAFLRDDRKCVMLLVGGGEADTFKSALRGDGSRSLSAL